MTSKLISTGMMTTKRRRRKFKRQIREMQWVDDVRAIENEEAVVKTQLESKDTANCLIWMHYSGNFDFWGISQNKRRRLHGYDTPIIHAFLGPDKNQFYLYKDSEIFTRNLISGVQNDESGDHWKIEKTSDVQQTLEEHSLVVG